ncbi:GGDEF domain-containing response regulator [Aquibacillus rhizosphaerae]|uniref:Diguanylate cyclase n=1 Tax=Aquibacillus rhizosphaerae TaxID=3051431 RepID=A0ABT7L7X3_9BACI|nr:diguanylate cyclase [Aquibacillus sp. LR5S19]MDL4841966.1 diguanylate cyclase [Aquibacillus sp. LR5S19]
MTEVNNCKVLMVDDRAENLLALEAILEGLDVKLLKANSGNDALSLMLEEEEIALVLLDVQMPEMDGFEVAEIMKSSERTKYIPIIFVTAISKEDKYVSMAYDSGAVDYLLKPIVPEFLISKVKVFMELHRQKQKIKQQAMELEEANAKLRDLSYIDGLTQIPNRRNFDENLEKEWKNAIRSGSQISLILIDVDFFKDYNDIYGHSKGDECLKNVGTTLASAVQRPRDLVARYGGEEFVVILTDTSQQDAEMIANQMKDNIEGLQIAHGKSSVSNYVTISGGIATMKPKVIMKKEEISQRADQALYKAKELGRNQIVAFNVGKQ